MILKKKTALIASLHVLILCSFLIIPFNSCKKFLDAEGDKSKVEKEDVFSSDITATSAITGIYDRMVAGEQSFASTPENNIMSLTGLSADELENIPRTNPFILQFESNDITAENPHVYAVWRSFYQFIYYCNSALEGLKSSGNITEPIRMQLIGEATFVRAFCYFYLVNLFGDVPLVMTSDYSSNAIVRRMRADSVFNQIITDLISSVSLLSVDYPMTDEDFITPARVRPNKGAASALLARVYLYLGDWKNAEIHSASVISDSNTYKLCNNLAEVFLRNSSESIWQLKTLSTPAFTMEAYVFDPQLIGSYDKLSVHMVNSFEAADHRFSEWVNSTGEIYYPTKYRHYAYATSPFEYSTVLRLAEMYLIRAEARVHLGKLIGPNSAEHDLNTIRNRAGLPNSTAQDEQQLLDGIAHERKVELFTEWGHRWLDLKRLGSSEQTLSPLKSGFDDHDILYPIPQRELLNNSNLGQQNTGY